MLFSVSCCLASPSMSWFDSNTCLSQWGAAVSGRQRVQVNVRKLALNSVVSSHRFCQHPSGWFWHKPFISITCRASVFFRHGHVHPNRPRLFVAADVVYPARSARLPLVSGLVQSSVLFFCNVVRPNRPSSHPAFMHCIASSGNPTAPPHSRISTRSTQILIKNKWSKTLHPFPY